MQVDLFLCFLIVSLYITYTATQKNFLETMLPLNKVAHIARKHAKNDPAFNQVLRIIHGEEWTKNVQSLVSSKEWEQYKNNYVAAGIDIEKLLGAMSLVIKNVKPGDTELTEPNLHSFIEDLKTVVPLKTIIQILKYLDIGTIISNLQEGDFKASENRINERKDFAFLRKQIESWLTD